MMVDPIPYLDDEQRAAINAKAGEIRSELNRRDEIGRKLKALDSSRIFIPVMVATIGIGGFLAGIECGKTLTPPIVTGEIRMVVVEQDKATGDMKVIDWGYGDEVDR